MGNWRIGSWEKTQSRSLERDEKALCFNYVLLLLTFYVFTLSNRRPNIIFVDYTASAVEQTFETHRKNLIAT